MAYREKKSKACRLPRHAQTCPDTVDHCCLGAWDLCWWHMPWSVWPAAHGVTSWQLMLPGEEVLQSYLTSHPDDAQAAGLTRSTEQKKSKVRKCQESLINAAQFTVDSEFLGSCPSRWFFLWHSSTHNSTNMKQQWRQRLWMVQTSRDFILCW